MSTNMELITSVTVGSGGAASVTLPATGTIPQTYTDLKIVYSVRSDNTNPSNTIDISFNGNTTGFTNRYLIGTGSSTASGSNFGRYAGAQNSANETASTFSNGDIYIPNYTNTSINKSYSSDGVYENNATGAGQGLVAGLWSNTAAITTITLTGYAGNFVQGSTFYLYGISNVTSTTKATGGIVSSDGTYNYHMFPYSGTFTPTAAITVDLLVVAGGGGGGGIDGSGRTGAGGGGAGGYLEQTGRSLSINTPYTVLVGAGGAKGVTAASASPSNVTAGSTGSDSIFDTSTALGGGGGAAAGVESQTHAKSGGSGGGGGAIGGGPKNGAAATQGNSGGATGYGFAGGNGTNTASYQAGSGGGGAGGAGGNSTADGGPNGGTAGAGGQGRQSSITGTATYYAAGGAGSNEGNSKTNTGSVNGIGGQSATGSGQQATNGVVNTGSGGGAAAGQGVGVMVQAGAGGSGIVIIRYAI